MEKIEIKLSHAEYTFTCGNSSYIVNCETLENGFVGYFVYNESKLLIEQDKIRTIIPVQEVALAVLTDYLIS